MGDGADQALSRLIDWDEETIGGYYDNPENLEDGDTQMWPFSRRENKEQGPGPCPKCGENTILRTGPFGTFYGCTAFPKCKGNRDGDGRIDKSLGPGLCPECGSETTIRKGKFGPFFGCIKYPKCKGKLKYYDNSSRP